MQSYEIKLRDVSYGKIFHQCVYILCETDEHTMAAGRVAREEYGLDPYATYMPHLSLLYSDIEPSSRCELSLTACTCQVSSSCPALVVKHSIVM